MAPPTKKSLTGWGGGWAGPSSSSAAAAASSRPEAATRAAAVAAAFSSAAAAAESTLGSKEGGESERCGNAAVPSASEVSNPKEPHRCYGHDEKETKEKEREGEEKEEWKEHKLETKEELHRDQQRHEQRQHREGDVDRVEEEEEKFYALVVDSGAIIKHAGYSTLHNAAERYLTVPAVLEEIRDRKAREHLESLPFVLNLRDPSPEAMIRVSNFARKTGDYRMLSRVDLQVLALLYDLEVEGCGGDVSHVRREPKRTLAGRIRPLNASGNERKKENAATTATAAATTTTTGTDEAVTGNDCAREEGNRVTAAAAKDARIAVATSYSSPPSFFEGEPLFAPAQEKDALRTESLARAGHCRNDETTSLSASASDLAPMTKPKSEPASWADLFRPAAEPSCPLPETGNVSKAMTKSGSGGGGNGFFAAIIAEQEEEKARAEATAKMEEGLGGQFDDASEEDDGEWLEAARAAAAATASGRERSDDVVEEGSDDDTDDLSDEEYDVYILDPEEAEERKKFREEGAAAGGREKDDTSSSSSVGIDVALELASDFPSLAVAATVPYEGSDGGGDRSLDAKDKKEEARTEKKGSYWDEEEERRKAESLKPLTKSKDGRLYNSFRKYGHVVKPAGVRNVPNGLTKKVSKADVPAAADAEERKGNEGGANGTENGLAAGAIPPSAGGSVRTSRISGGAAAFLGQSGNSNGGEDDDEDDDDGVGWIASPSELRALKASGALDPARSPGDRAAAGKGGGSVDDGPPSGDCSSTAAAHRTTTVRTNGNISSKTGGRRDPPPSKRAACATTDFAMQNVILQMNLTVLTVDGMRVRRVKSWVTRCDACYVIYAAGDASQAGGELGRRGLDRMFCDRCGSSALSRIACSVDGKTGRLKLHLSKRYRHNLRGTKFSLPKPGKGNRFEGDLLLCEDQLLFGAWNQKLKKGSGRREVQSIFGSGIASDVGCHAGLGKRDDIKVAFGKKNPNSTKFGRERRGKKKKNADKACGLRRY